MRMGLWAWDYCKSALVKVILIFLFYIFLFCILLCIYFFNKFCIFSRENNLKN